MAEQDAETVAYMARRATCGLCGEALVPSPGILGMWLSDRQGISRGLCPDGKTHVAEKVTATEPGAHQQPNPEHDLKFWGCQNPYGVMACCMPCSYHELLGDGLTYEQVTERTRDHHPAAGDELRVRIHRHLKKYPRLTATEIARALGAPDSSLRKLLRVMEADGEAMPETTPKSADTSKPVTRWTAT